MTEETKAPEGTEPPAEKAHEETVPFERFQQANKQAKEAKEAAKTLEKQMSDLRSEMDERASQGLPELEKLQKRLEAAEKRAEEADRKAAESDAKVARSAKERWVTAAAQTQNFADPSDASHFLTLDDIEDEKDAERAVKRLAGTKKHLLKAEEKQLPGRVLQDGRTVQPTRSGGHDPMAEAEMLAEGLRQFASKP